MHNYLKSHPANLFSLFTIGDKNNHCAIKYHPQALVWLLLATSTGSNTRETVVALSSVGPLWSGTLLWKLVNSHVKLSLWCLDSLDWNGQREECERAAYTTCEFSLLFDSTAAREYQKDVWHPPQVLKLTVYKHLFKLTLRQVGVGAVCGLTSLFELFISQQWPSLSLKN